MQKCLEVMSGELVVDATLGLGGHSEDLLKRLGNQGKLIAFEQDQRNLDLARVRLSQFSRQVRYIHDNFRYLKTRITQEGFGQVDAILFDLGLSSPHVDDPERGFSFLHDGPLDMRFDQRNELSAAEVVNGYQEAELARIFFQYGEERMARKFAREICEKRKTALFTTTKQLADFLEMLAPRFKGKKSAHPATKVFQALRIEVNDEITVLKEALSQAVEVLKVGGRLAVIAYHSLEDRLVKQFFKSLEKPKPEPEQLIYRNFGDPIVKIITRKPIIPSEEEIQCNPRSRSAKLRALKKIRNYEPTGSQ